jgi:hypothetical protein
LDRSMINELADRTDAYFGRACEYVFATYANRVRGSAERSNVFVHELSRDSSEWMGDPVQWAALFRKVLAPKA